MNIKEMNSVFGEMSDGVLLVKKGGSVDYINQAACRILGLKENISSVTDLFAVLLTHKLNDGFIDLITKAVEKKDEIQHAIVRYQNHSDKVAPVKQLEVKTSYASGEDAGVLIVIQDVTIQQEAQRNCRDSGIILAVFLGLLFGYSFIFALWKMVANSRNMGRDFTWLCLLIATIGCFISYKFTSLSLAKSGMKLSNLKSGAKQSVIYIVAGSAFFLAAKLLVIQILPNTFPADQPFLSSDEFQLINFIPYVFSAFMQEFVARIFVHENIVRVFDVYGRKKAGIAAVILSSFMFACVHLHQGFYYMLGAFILSLLLGTLYNKNTNFWMVVIIHIVVGTIGMSLL